MLDRKKHRQEVESLRADVKRKEMGIKWRVEVADEGIKGFGDCFLEEKRNYFWLKTIFFVLLQPEINDML